jgi:hypothetical protein
MCMIDGADERVNLLTDEMRTARKEHRCHECRRAILPGEKYSYESGVFDGRFCQYKTCAHCEVVKSWLAGECGGYIYGMVEEDIHEHASEGHYGFDVKKLAIGMSRDWRRRDGRLWPVPKKPPTTHQRMAAH